MSFQLMACLSGQGEDACLRRKHSEEGSGRYEGAPQVEEGLASKNALGTRVCVCVSVFVYVCVCGCACVCFLYPFWVA